MDGHPQHPDKPNRKADALEASAFSRRSTSNLYEVIDVHFPDLYG
jgi:hypothetical protein